jgi:hypothetical protein
MDFNVALNDESVRLTAVWEDAKRYLCREATDP